MLRPSAGRYGEHEHEHGEEGEENDPESPVFRAQSEAAKLAHDLARGVGYGDDSDDEGGGGGGHRL